VYENVMFPLLIPLSVRRLYTFFTQAELTHISMFLGI
jgi:hypothetical protein